MPLEAHQVKLGAGVIENNRELRAPTPAEFQIQAMFPLCEVSSNP